MINTAYIHEYGNRKIEPEHRDVMEVLEKRNISCELFTNKRILRNQLNIDENTFVAGDHFVFSSIFKKYKINILNNCYPKSLQKYLKRNIQTTTIKEITKNFGSNTPRIFVKPKSNTKLFTGFVIQSDTDLLHLMNFPSKTELYYSSIVDWVSEYRVFVHNSKIVGIKMYSGDETHHLDLNFVHNAIDEFEASNEKTKGYGIDFGILSNGETSLVEWNDGFALGSYHLDKEIYTDLLLERWKEILCLFK